MSSFIGHTLTGLGVYATTKSPKKLALRDLLWLGWLTFVAVAPDVDYILPALRTLKDSGLRVTHSIVGCLVFPLLTLPVLMRLNLKRETRRLYITQVFLAGLSHIVMDTLVGVWPLPLLWPFTSRRFGLPFGLLPSAPAFRLDNPYMYRNLLMEIGIFIPLYAGIYLLRFGKGSGWKRYSSIAVLWLCAASFMGWASTLAR